MDKKSNLIVYILVLIVGFGAGWQATERGYIGGSGEIIESEDADEGRSLSEIFSDSNNEAAEHGANLSLFWTVWDELESKHVEGDDLDSQELVYGSIKGLVDAIDDPYTVFMTPDESEQFSASLDGELEGIGAELTLEDDQLVIVSPLRDSPAEKAGLKPGNIIFMIDGDFAADMNMFDAIMRIRGEKGTTVVLTIIREEVDEPFEVSIVRDNIDLESVTKEDLEGNIAYISINQFSDGTVKEFDKAVQSLILNEPKGLIIDLRFNGGGYLDIAVELLSYLFEEGTEAVSIKQRDKEEDVLSTNGRAKLLNVPLVVLVNEGSASASEIVAGAVQDLKRGVVMGNQTFGKGTVQEVETFSDGSSIRITIAKWFTPDGRSIDKVGLTPDIIVDLDDEDLENEIDTQKEAAADYLRKL